MKQKTSRPLLCALDGHTLNPGDNPWTEVEELGTLRVYDRTPAHLIVERASEAEIIITDKNTAECYNLKTTSQTPLHCHFGDRDERRRYPKR